MNDRELEMARNIIAQQCEDLTGLRTLLANKSRECDRAVARATHTESLLAHLRTSLNEQHNDPMQDGGAA